MAYIELGPDNGGILLNMSEGGLAVQSAMVLRLGDLPPARFQLPGSRAWIDARVRVLRLSESQKEAAVEFVQISEEAKAQIREWVAGSDVEGETSRREVDLQPGPPKVRKEEEPAHFADPAEAPVAKNHAWDTLAPAPLASNWVDQEIFEQDQTNGAPGNTRWLRFSFVAIVLAVLFFFVGSNIAQTPLHHWFISTIEKFSGSKPNVAEAPTDADTQASVEPPTNAPAPSSAPPPSETDGKIPPAGQGFEPAQQPAETTSARDGGPTHLETSPADGVAKPASAEPPSADQAAGRRKAAVGFHVHEEFPSDHQLSAAAGIDRKVFGLTEHTILVTAPAAGNPDFYVNLPEEAISASSRIAMTAHRSLRISPRSANPQAERVRIGQIVSRSEPYYPAQALRQKIDGNVRLHAVVSPTGEITDVRAVSGPPILAAAATAAVRDWRYEPTLIDGNAVQTEADILVSFRLP
jgi:TonB family protein